MITSAQSSSAEREVSPAAVIAWFALVESVAVSRRGDVAYTVRRPRRDGSAYLWELWGALPEDKPFCLARGIDSGFAPAFAPMDGRLAYVRLTRQRGGLARELCVLDLTQPKDETLVATLRAPRALAWSPRGDAIYVVREGVKPSPLIGESGYLRSNEAHLHGAHAAPAVLERLRAGEPAEIIGKLDPGAGSFAIDPSGTRIAYLSNLTGLAEDNTFELRTLTFDTPSPVTLAGGLKGAFGPVWMDERTLVVAARADERFSFSQTVAQAIDLETRAARPVAAGIEGEVRAARVAGDSLLLSVGEGLDNHLWQVRDKDANCVMRDVVTFDVSHDGVWLASVRESGRGLPEVQVTSLASEQSRQLTSHSRRLRRLRLPRVETVRWRGYDDEAVEGLLIRPPDPEPDHPIPTLVSVHGGPFHRAQRGLQNWGNLRAFVYAAAGYAVFMPNFHGSCAYGNQFSISLFEKIGVADFADLMTGVDHLIEAGIADADRLGIFGGSYGGYLTNWVISQTDRFKAAVSHFGIWDLIGDYGNTFEDLWPPRYLGVTYLEDLALHRRFSPSSYVDQIRTPVLLTHGEEDLNVFINNSQEMWRALKSLGRTVEFVRYPGEGHGYARPAHMLDELLRTLLWFDRYVREASPQRGP